MYLAKQIKTEIKYYKNLQEGEQNFIKHLERTKELLKRNKQSTEGIDLVIQDSKEMEQLFRKGKNLHTKRLHKIAL